MPRHNPAHVCMPLLFRTALLQPHGRVAPHHSLTGGAGKRAPSGKRGERHAADGCTPATRLPTVDVHWIPLPKAHATRLGLAFAH
eukprot:1641290-Prymnesium_polylepis.1